MFKKVAKFVAAWSVIGVAITLVTIYPALMVVFMLSLVVTLLSVMLWDLVNGDA